MSSVGRSWIVPSVLLCSNGFLRSFNPGDSYLTPYLMSPPKNFTASELVNQIYPVWIYAYICFLVPAFLLTDFIKYKPAIVVGGICYAGCWLLLLFGQNVLAMQAMQVFYGMAKAGNIGYDSYIYSIAPEDKYRQVTSYTRTVLLLGRFSGAVLAQILVSFFYIDYFYLNVITFVNICLGFFVSLFLPMPKKTLYFYAAPSTANGVTEMSSIKDSEDEGSGKVKEQPTETVSKKWKAVLFNLGKDLKTAFSNPVLFRWSLWWVLSTCGYLLIVNYIQNFWETVNSSQNSNGNVYNGAVQSVATILGAIGSFSVGYIKLNWTRWGEMALGIFSIFECVMLVLMYLTNSIWTCYVTYILYIFLHHFIKTVTHFNYLRLFSSNSGVPIRTNFKTFFKHYTVYQVAIGLNNERYALIFGMNSFLAVALSTAVTVVVIDDVGFGLGVRTQFLIYCIYFGLLSLLFLSRGFFEFVSSRSRLKTQELTVQIDEVIEDD